MTSPDLNLPQLDQWVLQYLQSEGLAQVPDQRTSSSSAASTSQSSSQEEAKAATHAVHHLLQRGRVADACAVIQEVCPDLLKDLRLVFHLKKQQFIEWLRLQTPHGDAQALAYAREELAPLAQHAYLEAYSDFKRALLLLVSPRAGSPGDGAGCHQPKEELREAAREALAATVAGTMRQHTGWSDAPLALLLRYWCHLVLTASGGSSGGGRMWEVAAAVAEQREVATTVVPGGGLAGQGLPVDTEGAPLPEERDVQALITALGLPRSEAREALKHAPRSPAAAFLSELHRVGLEAACLDELAWEYALSRGLLQPSHLADAAPLAAAATWYERHCSDTSLPEPADGTSRMSVDGSAAPPAAAAPAAGTGDGAAAGGGGGQAAAGGGAGGGPGPNGAFSSSWGRSASQSPPLKMPRCLVPSSAAAASAAAGGGAAAAAGGGGGAASTAAAAVGGSGGGTQSAAADQQQQQGEGAEGEGTAGEGSPSGLHKLHHAWQLYVRLQRLCALHMGEGAPAAAAAAAAEAGGDGQQAAAGDGEQGGGTAGSVGDGPAARDLLQVRAWAAQQPDRELHVVTLVLSPAEAAAARAAAAATESNGHVSPPPSAPAVAEAAAAAAAAAGGGGGGAREAAARAAAAAGGGGGGAREALIAEGGAAAAAEAAPAPPRHPVAVYWQQQQALEGLKQRLMAGDWGGAEGGVEGLAPGLLGRCPALRFALLRCHFMKMAADGDATGALLLAREHMTPLVDTAPELLPVLKSSMALLVRPEAAGQTPPGGQSQTDGQPPTPEEVAALLALLGQRLQEGGPQELRAPRLQQLLRGLSRGYLLWLQIQRCRDPFATALGIPEVLTGQAAPPAAAGGGGGSGATGRGQQAVGVSLDTLLFGPGVRPGVVGRPPGRRLPQRAVGGWGVRRVVEAAGSSEEDESMSEEEEEGGGGGGGGGAGRLAAVLAGARARAMQAWPAGDRALSAAAAAAYAGAAGPGQAAAGQQQQQEQQQEQDDEEEHDVEEVQVLLGGGGGGVDGYEAQQWLEAHADEGPLDEAAILQVMEVLDTSRAAAMELLAEHAGSAERVINEFFGA